MRLLLVEDYKPLRSAMVQALQEEGYAVDESGDGEEGLWYAERNEYDCVVLDIMLPGLDGLAILRAIRSGDRNPAVIITSAKDTVEDKISGLDAGADDYLIKPFALSELLARIRALLRRGEGHRQPDLQVADLCLSPATRLVHRGLRSIELSPREYALLELLMRRSGQVVTREDIWEHVYDFNADATSNVVDVIIGRLRRKIQLDGELPLIHTRRGYGYLLNGESD